MLRVAAVQFKTFADRGQTLQAARELIGQAASSGAQLVALPECWTGPYGVPHFPTHAEDYLGSESGSLLMQTAAAEHGIHVCGGVIEKDLTSSKLFNTVFAFGPNGDLAARYRKLHLSRVHVGADRTSEGSVLTPGDELVSFEVGAFKVGLLNCFDLRFRDASTILGEMGCHVILYPAAWLKTTGDLGHWHTLLKARALDNQLYTVGIDVAQDDEAEVVAYGDSVVYCPLGQDVGSRLPKTEAGVVIADISMDHLDDVRERIPLGPCVRRDVFQKHR